MRIRSMNAAIGKDISMLIDTQLKPSQLPDQIISICLGDLVFDSVYLRVSQLIMMRLTRHINRYVLGRIMP